MNINDELTQAAREGASGINPPFDNFTPSDQQKIIDHLEYNDGDRLVTALQQYARLLSKTELDAILAE